MKKKIIMKKNHSHNQQTSFININKKNNSKYKKKNFKRCGVLVKKGQIDFFKIREFILTDRKLMVFKKKYFNNKKTFFLLLNLISVISNNFEYLSYRFGINQYRFNHAVSTDEQIYRFTTYFLWYLFYQFNLLKSVNIKNLIFSLKFLKNYYDSFSLNNYMINYARYLYLKNKLADKFSIERFQKENKMDGVGTNNIYDKIKVVSPEEQEEYKKKFFIFFIKIYKFFIQKGLSRKMIKVWVQALFILKFRYKKDYITKFFKCLENIRPLIRFFQMRIGGKKYQIPIFIGKINGYLLAMRWLSNFSREKGTTITKNLINLLEHSIKKSGSIVKYKNDQFLLAIANKNYIRFLRFLKH